MANYEAPIYQVTMTTTFRSAGSVYANTTAVQTRRIQIYEYEFGQYGALASTDCQVLWDVSRFSSTAILTATAVVPNLLDGADTSPNTLFYNNNTGELTYTGVNFGLSLKQWSINQRGFNRWRALDDGDNILVAATAANGVGIRAQSTNYQGSVVGNMSFIER